MKKQERGAVQVMDCTSSIFELLLTFFENERYGAKVILVYQLQRDGKTHHDIARECRMYDENRACGRFLTKTKRPYSLTKC